ncbi:hypothetical protein [Bradyrhizobium sp. dw_411]|uniref:hypothetical protein n=1 Tax=Bradyrhizobium sp. dw_411 TaxID=2720082 RepID=UPI00201C861B|nr:hypothetical protein [Bradyrhizobium sp. dw_411]
MLLMFYRINTHPLKGPLDLKFFAPAMLASLLALMPGIAPAFAEVEQCRFIQAKPDREACYRRQEAALAEKRQQEASRASENAKGMESLEQMKHEDIELNRQLHNICRGC